jgi:hypothetical protein
MTAVPATATVRGRRAAQISQSECIVKLTVDRQSSVGGDAAAMQLELEPTVEIDL